MILWTQGQILAAIRSGNADQQRRDVMTMRLLGWVAQLFFATLFWFVLTGLFLNVFDPALVFGALLLPSIAFYLTCLLLGYVGKTGLDVHAAQIEAEMQGQPAEVRARLKKERILKALGAALVCAALTFGYFMPFFQDHAVKVHKTHKVKKQHKDVSQ
ncbi:MAG: hypothetical protein GC134_06845 [Proteobacteria bacterium]|nr:hypothetical protein [Pseudomonadota bacterium]